MTRPPGFLLFEVDSGGGFPRRVVTLSPLDVASITDEPTGIDLGGTKVMRVIVHSLTLGKLGLSVYEWATGREITLLGVNETLATAMRELRAIVPEKP